MSPPARSVAATEARAGERIAAPGAEAEHCGREHEPPLRPCDLAVRALFAPIADWLTRSTASDLPSCAQLNDWIRDPSVCGAVPPRFSFVTPDRMPLGYEQRIHERGEVVTRPHNWHDFFNALVWMRFPRSKRALNEVHLRFAPRRGTGAGRGPVRDAVTQFDESGIIVASADASLLDLLERRSWKELFWIRRAEVVETMRFLVFGHGLYDALRAPFHRICGRAAAIVVDRGAIEGEIAGLCDCLDRLLAARFAADYYPRPRALLALPLLGIPGVTAENAAADYYDDVEQFRPPPAWITSPGES